VLPRVGGGYVPWDRLPLCCVRGAVPAGWPSSLPGGAYLVGVSTTPATRRKPGRGSGFCRHGNIPCLRARAQVKAQRHCWGGGARRGGGKPEGWGPGKVGFGWGGGGRRARRQGRQVSKGGKAGGVGKGGKPGGDGKGGKPGGGGKGGKPGGGGKGGEHGDSGGLPGGACGLPGGAAVTAGGVDVLPCGCYGRSAPKYQNG